MSASVFSRGEFWAMVITTAALPMLLYGVLLVGHRVSRRSVFTLGVVLVAMAAVDIYFLQNLAVLAQHTASVLDDAVFLSHASFVLYVLPLVFGGIGVNLISHVLLEQLRGSLEKCREERAQAS